MFVVFCDFCIGIGHCDGLIISFRGVLPSGVCLIVVDLETGGLSPIWTVATYIYIYRVSQEECARLRESVPYVKVYRYNPKHLYPKLNGYEGNG